MSFIYKKANIRDKRVKNFIDTLHRAFTNIMLIEYEFVNLVDETTEKSYIASRSQPEGETSPILPLGDELVFQFGSLNLDFSSKSKFIIEEYDIVSQSYISSDLNILELDYQAIGEVLPSGTVALSNGLKIRDGEVIFKNLELYDYDYESYEFLNEIYRALEIFFDSVELFYRNFYQDTLGAFKEANNDYDDSGADDRLILVFDTREMDDEIQNVVFPIADTIPNATYREDVKDKYREIRDKIKFFAMNKALEIDEEIERLLFAINGSKKYSIRQNIETKQLEFLVDENGLKRRIHAEEEVFFPFHNKPTLGKFIEGLQNNY